MIDNACECIDKHCSICMTEDSCTEDRNLTSQEDADVTILSTVSTFTLAGGMATSLVYSLVS